ncbi:MAG TPA: hypothetical protein VH186_22030 [Chloroflexia bacterium]|nr:hypothetical protein [Chloroflexia bacterium]
MPRPKSQLLFLQEPEALPELDSWVQLRAQDRQPFTFAEREALNYLWEEGQEIRLREDNRFVPVKLSPGQWRLIIERLANEKLYEALLDESWDGQDLLSYLHSLDAEADKPYRHIFCPADPRFELVKASEGSYNLKLKALSGQHELTSEQKAQLSQLLTQFVALESGVTTGQLLAAYQQQFTGEALAPSALESWLLQQPEWTRIGLDRWLPRQFVPAPAPVRRYAVLPVTGGKLEPVEPEMGATTITEIEPEDDREPVEESGPLETEEDTQAPLAIGWKVTLRAWQLNEGVVSVPKAAQTLYPRAYKLGKILALSALWYEDGADFTVWLDKAAHRLFGPELQEKLDFLGAGTILQVRWSQAGLTFTVLGEDSAVSAEEARLVDLTALAALRSTELESYRASLRALLTSGPLSFAQLYEQLCQRQQHKANRHTVSSILSGSPEFSFDHATKQWALNLAVSNEDGARHLRQAIILSKGANDKDASSRTLSEVVSINMKKLEQLRQKLLERPAES